jgi:hypothetical protein
MFSVGARELGLKFVYISGDPADPANKEFRVYYSVVEHGETPPDHPRELSESFSTQRKKEVVHFDYTDSGKEAFFCVQVENLGKKGPWGPMVRAFIP